MADKAPIRRRDFIVVAAATATGVGATVALWPFIASMNPAADTMARRSIFSLNDLKGAAHSVVAIDGMPIIIFRRTMEELAALRDTALPNKTRDPSSSIGNGFRDRDSNESIQPSSARNWHRSLRPEIMVCVDVCTHDSCLVQFDKELFCPCCGSRYDLAGRAFSGPAPRNLRVPQYRYINDEEIEFSQ